MPKEKKQINIEIGFNVKRERERAQMTQERFSEMIGIGPKSLSAIECGSVGFSLTTMKTICETLAIPADALLFGRKQPNDVQDLTERLERLTPSQLNVAKDILYKLLEAFRLQEETQDSKDDV